jgi:protein-S-isoprenylcysteine O-methyltransferase Ste14
MKLDAALAVGTASLTLLSFGAGMKWFRKSNHRAPAKLGLTASAVVCAVTQVVILAATPRPGAVCRWAGIALYLLAHVVYWWSLAAHGGKRPAFALVPVKPTFLTQSGPYRLVRHPIYTAYLLVWFAGPVACAQPCLLVTTLWMLCFHYYAARQEERLFARSELADDYAAYKGRTGMFLPTPWSWSPAFRQSFRKSA